MRNILKDSRIFIVHPDFDGKTKNLFEAKIMNGIPIII